jgi:transaldolase
MTQTAATCLWNDSADPDELRQSIEHGGVGATCNPVIAHTVLKARMAEWRPRIAALISDMPTATEDQIGWAAWSGFGRCRPLLPAPAAHQGRNGRLSIQTDPRRTAIPARLSNRRAASMAGAEHDRQDPRHQRRYPRSTATAQGISINATVSFTLPHAWPWPRPWSAGCSAASRTATTSLAWGRSAPSWSAGWTTG